MTVGRIRRLSVTFLESVCVSKLRRSTEKQLRKPTHWARAALSLRVGRADFFQLLLKN